MPDAHPPSTIPASSPATHHGRRLPLRVGTRGSPLARTQTKNFLDLLTRVCPGLGVQRQPVFEEHVIRTTGDAVQDRSLADIGGKGLFSTEIHEALLDRRIDFAVHSLKDLETELPPNATIGTNRRRRQAQLLRARPNLRIVLIRGNVQPRIAKVARLGTELGNSLRADCPPDVLGDVLRATVRHA